MGDGKIGLEGKFAACKQRGVGSVSLVNKIGMSLGTLALAVGAGSFGASQVYSQETGIVQNDLPDIRVEDVDKELDHPWTDGTYSTITGLFAVKGVKVPGVQTAYF